jgi:hypothetical protein
MRTNAVSPAAPVRARKRYNAGDHWCIADGCEAPVSAMIMCCECGVRFACDIWEHRFLLHRIEKRRRHLRNHIRGGSFFMHEGWPWVRTPPPGRVDRAFEKVFDWTAMENTRARKERQTRGTPA